MSKTKTSKLLLKYKNNLVDNGFELKPLNKMKKFL